MSSDEKHNGPLRPKTEPAPAADAEREARELEELTSAIFQRSGLDFRNYASASLKRRVMRIVTLEHAGTIANLQHLVLQDSARLDRLLSAITVHVTSMFRDPGFFRVFRQDIAPILRTYPFLRFWVAGCSTGEEVYSLAILLHECGLYSRCRIYATDVSDAVLARAKNGIYPLSSMQEFTRNYQLANGASSFAEYYTADSESAIFRPFLKENIAFATHNLACDASFNEFHGISCRNVMIYFNKSLQERVHKLFYDSLVPLGYLGLGRSESIRFTSYEDCYEAVSAKERLYRKIK